MEYVSVAAIGLAIGSFLNVLIDRLPVGQTVLWGRSHCDHCRKTLRWYELIPLFSFIVQKGRCRRCHTPISIQNPLVEVAAALGFIALFYVFSTNPVLLFSSYLIYCSLFVIFVADIKTQIIPDSMIVVGVIGVVIELLYRFGLSSALLPFLLSAACGSLFFLFLWLVTKRRGMGLGDVKLVFLMGLLLGYPSIVAALYVAFLTGALLSVILILRREKTLKSKIAFGPFLIGGLAIAVLFGQKILVLWRMIL